MPKHTAQTILAYINNAEHILPAYQELFKRYFGFLLNYKSKRNTTRSYNTIYIDVLIASTFCRSIGFNFENINTIAIAKFLEGKEVKGQFFGKLRIFFDFLVREKVMNDNIKSEIFFNNHYKNPIHAYKEKKFAIPQHKWIDLYNQLSGVRKFALWFLFHTGVRVGELISLETKDIVIDETKDIYYVKIYPHPNINFYPKTESSIRDIPLRKQEINVIKQYLAIRNKKNLIHDYLLYNTKDSSNVYIQKSKDQRIMVEGTVEAWLDEVFYYDEIPKENFRCEKKIISKKTHKDMQTYTPYCYEVFPHVKSHRHITPHLCRYSFASNIYYKGKDQGVDLLNEVSKLLGHSNPQITFEYLQLDKIDQQRRTLNALDIAYQN